MSMSRSNNRLAHKILDKDPSLLYRVAQKWCRRIATGRGKFLTRDEVEEHVQDAVCRAVDGFLKRCENGLPKVQERDDWLCQSALFGLKHSLGTARRFGNPAPHVGYVDALNRRGSWTDLQEEPADRVDEGTKDGPQRADIERVIEREGIPEGLRKTALYAALGFSAEDSARLQGCTKWHVYARTRQLREFLDPPSRLNPYAIIVDAIESLLNRQ